MMNTRNNPDEEFKTLLWQSARLGAERQLRSEVADGYGAWAADRRRAHRRILLRSALFLLLTPLVYHAVALPDGRDMSAVADRGAVLALANQITRTLA